MSLMLAIDQSTSATKAMLIDTSGQIIDKSSRHHQQIYPQPGWVEHDPREIGENLTALFAELAERNRGFLDRIAGVSIANQRETFVVFDPRTGAPLHNAIVWQCRRGDALCRQLTSAGHDQVVRAKTGLKLDTYFPASKIAWLMQSQPHLADMLRSGEAVVGTIDTWLIHRLTAASAFVTDHTNASRTLLYDAHRLAWDAELCAVFGVPREALPEIRESGAIVGETDLGGVLPHTVPICGVMGDSQASLFAQGCHEAGTGKATFGTGTSVLLNIGHQACEPPRGCVLALAWVIDAVPTYALEGIINYSAATIAWLKDQLGLIDDVSQCEALANQVPDNGGVYLVPAFAGLSAPHWNHDARAAIVGMSGHTTKAHVVRAALESIAYQIQDVLQILHGEGRPAPQRLSADGGPTGNQFLMQFTADITQTQWHVSQVSEASAQGAALAGMLGLGLLESVNQVADLPRTGARYSPRMSAEEAARLHGEWLRAVQRVLL